VAWCTARRCRRYSGYSFSLDRAIQAIGGLDWLTTLWLDNHILHRCFRMEGNSPRRVRFRKRRAINLINTMANPTFSLSLKRSRD
jgi:hypothetical protein